MERNQQEESHPSIVEAMPHIESLQKTIAQLKGQIKRSDGELNLLRFRLTKAGVQNSTRASESDPSPSITNAADIRSNQYWIQHYVIWKKVMSSILKPAEVEILTTETIPINNCFASSADVIADLRSQLVQYRRLNDRLESQLRSWVDTQIQLHKDLSVHEAKVIQFQAVCAATNEIASLTPATAVAPGSPIREMVQATAQPSSPPMSTPLTPTPAPTAGKDSSTQKLMRGFARTPVPTSFTSVESLASSETTKVVVDRPLFEAAPDTRSGFGFRDIAASSSERSDENADPVTIKIPRSKDKQTRVSFKDFGAPEQLPRSHSLRQLADRPKGPSARRTQLTDVTNVQNPYHLESYDLDDSVVFNFKNSPFSQSLPQSQLGQGKKAAPRHAAPGLLVELTPCSFQKQMSRMHKENLSIKDDIARFRRNLQVRG